MSGFCDVKKWDQDKSFQNFFHLFNVNYNLYNSIKKQTEIF